MNRSLKIYLCASYERRDELRGYRGKLNDLGHYVTSRWLDEDYALNVQVADLTREQQIEIGEYDLKDIDAADFIIAFTEPAGTHRSRGGRHVEFGYALAKGIGRFVVGPFENIFCAFSWRFESFDECLAELKKKHE